MFDLRDPRLLKKAQERKKEIESSGSAVDELLTEEQLENRLLASELEDKVDKEELDVRSRSKTTYQKSVKKTGSIFDFLLTEDFIDFFLSNLQAYHTLADPSNKKSKTTLLSQKRFLDHVKSLRSDDEKLQKASQSSFYKWLCRNGFGTKEQITKYYKSRSKEVANQLKRRVIIEELVEDLNSRPELVDRLFENKYFVNKIKNLIKGG